MGATWSADARYTDLVRRRGGELVRLAVMLTGNRLDDEDAVQDAFIAVAHSWPSRVFRSEGSAYAYLRTAVARKAIDCVRRRRPLGEMPDLPIEDHDLLRFEEDRAFFARLQQLPEQQRTVLVLRYYLDLDDRRIADLLDITRATVRSNAMRGLDKLRAETRAVAEER